LFKKDLKWKLPYKGKGITISNKGRTLSLLHFHYFQANTALKKYFIPEAGQLIEF